MWLSLHPQLRAAVAVVSIVFCLLAGCSQQTSHNEILPQEIPPKETTSQPTTSPEVLPGIVRWETVPPLRHDVAIMENVFWEPADTDSLRAFV